MVIISKERAILLSTLVIAVAAYVYWRLSHAAQNALSSASVGASSSGGGLIESLTQVPQEVASVIDRGFRNNNPGNIEGNLGFQGQTGVDSGGYAVFSDMQYGLRAIAVIIKNYYRLHGLDTIDGIIRRWSATDQDAYVANVSAIVGVDPQETIDPTDPTTLGLIVQGIVTQENGPILAAAITQQQIDTGVSLA